MSRQPLVPLPHVEPGMRIGLLGGSFNPPHAGHRHVSVEAIRRLGLDQVWWMVSPGNPLKSHRDLPPLAERIRQAIDVSAHPGIVVTGFEAGLGTAYTAEALRYLTRRNPRAHLVWLMGADNLAQVHRWRRWRAIFANMPVAVLDRPGWRLKGLASPAASTFRRQQWPECAARRLAAATPPAWTFLSIPLSGLSSTELRRQRSGRRHR
ncbi:MAG: nicotinate-nucleotide adenylyltransferase [Hyphomicrobiaceae bacterium]